jgi:uncharacterized membrane protein AbrB (regulator of aidB expression)
MEKRPPNREKLLFVLVIAALAAIVLLYIFYLMPLITLGFGTAPSALNSISTTANQAPPASGAT